MKFSIIIPTYNRAHLIQKTIKSILNQTYQNFEVLVIDDGSIDNTNEVISKIKDNRLFYYKKENAERGAARNFGVNKGTGEYITFLDSDDLLLPNYLQEAKLFISKNNSDVFFQLFETRDSKNQLIKKAIQPPLDINASLINKGNIFACQGAFIKKTKFLSYLFNEDRKLAGSEDYELWLRINAQEKIMCNPIITSILVEHEERSVLNFNTKALIERKTLMLKYLLMDKKSNQYYLPYLNVLYSNSYSYISIHLILANYKRLGLNYYIKALNKRPLLLFSRKSLAIFKHLILN